MPANFPNSPTTNQLYSYNGATWKWTGAKWQLVTVANANTGTLFTYSNAVPQSPSLGDRWLNSETLRQSIYINDGDSDQWVEPVSIGMAGATKSLNNLSNVAVNTDLIPGANLAYDLGTNSLRWRDLYLSGNSIRLGEATLSSTGTAVNLPAGTTVGGQNVATTGEVSTGGGPKISNIQITNPSWTVLDDTAVDTAGGHVLVTGTNFVAGCLVYFNQTPANSVAFVGTTSLRVAVPALAAGTYIVYVINPDGGTAIRVPGLTASASPAWQTASGLPDQYDNTAITLSLVAADATGYTLTSGSLPPGLSLNTATGIITGTVTTVTVDTTYTFTITATDAQLQDSPRTFTVTITVSDPYFKLTTLLLSGEQGNTVIRDSSVNNFNLTVYGDARASNFTPYGTGWSVYFDGTGDYIQTPTNAAFQMGTGDYTLECWAYFTATPPNQFAPLVDLRRASPNFVAPCLEVSSSLKLQLRDGSTGANPLVGATTLSLNTWHHLAITRQSGSTRCFVNGVLDGSVSNTTNFNSTVGFTAGVPGDSVGAAHTFIGYLSNARVVKGTALYTANFTPATTTLTAVANTSLLTCHTNRFLDGSTNNFVITRNGDAAVRSFNPFNVTNTGADGSAYFDGTGDYLTLSANSAFAIGTGDFTFDCWLYPLASNSGLFTMTASGINDLVISNNWNPNTGSTTSGTASVTLGATTITAPTNAIVQNAWNHIAVVRSSGSIRVYVNGAGGTQTTNTSNVTGSYAPQIGALYTHSASATPACYMFNMRLVKGTAVYDPSQSTIAVPTAPLTAIANTQLLTLQYRQPHNNHGFQDASSNQFLITRNGNASQGTFSPFAPGGWSTYHGSNQYYYIANPSFGTGAWCVEGWFWLSTWTTISTAGVGGFWGFSNGGGGAPKLLCYYGNPAGYILVDCGTDGGSFTYQTSTSEWPLNTWVHLAIAKEGTGTNQTRMFINGVLKASGTTTNHTSTANFYVGLAEIFAIYNSYVSNFRVVKGSPVYTSNFQPPTAPLTAIPGTYFLSSQSNRFIDNSGNNRTITLSGTPSIMTFSPFAPTVSYSPAVHGGSAYFDGTGDYLSFVNNNQINFGSSPFTLEVWFYSVSTNTRQDFITQWASNNRGSYLGIGFLTGGASRIQFVYSTTGGNELAVTDTTNFVPYQWYHVAACRTANTISLFVNGVRVATTTESGAIYNSTRTPITVGAYSGNSGEEGLQPLIGYLSGLRVIKGASIYDATQTSITIPTAPSVSTTNTQLLLNFTDAAIVDRTGRAVVETVADAKSSSVQVKYGTGSMSFDGTGDYLAIPSNPFHNQLYATTRSFTIEFWIYLQAYPGASVAATVISTYGGGGGADGWRIETSPNSPANAIRWVSNGSDTACNSTIELNTWIHYAFTYNGTTIKVFKNGVAGSTATTSWTNNTGRMFIGTANAGLAFPITGYINDLRITNAERYTANFTPPTGPHRLK